MPGTGRGTGRGGGSRGAGQRSDGRGGGMGAAGNCVCVKCGYSAPKKRGIPCRDERCPKCGAVLLREGGPHHQQAIKTQK
jgi:hypothetical protein